MVGSVEEARAIQAAPNLIHIMLNKGSGEIYLKQFNQNNGLVEFETYKLIPTPKPISVEDISRQLADISSRLSNLEKGNANDAVHA